jgi:diguanylate cyclase (GGDEF)-like protein
MKERVISLTRSFEWGMRIGFALSPLIAIAYLHYLVEPTLRFIDFGFHEFAIGVAISLSAFVAYVTWRCYRHSGEPFLFWVAQGLTGFTVTYLPHGLLTRTIECNDWLFILFGPASRVVMAACLLVGLLQYGRPAHDPQRRLALRPVWAGLTVFLLIDLAVAVFAVSPIAGSPWLRLGMESAAILLSVVAIIILMQRRIASPLMWMYALALAAFVQSSLSFMLALPWSHQWWLAHLIFAAGFFMLSYGILQAFHTTRAFSLVYGQEEMMRRLEHANNELERLAAHDSLTGAVNRRHFLARSAEEMARARRQGTPITLLILDLDHFKAINDRHGHPAGDAVLVAVVERAQEIVRLPDLVGRFGGEEFVILLPGSTAEQAASVGERIRAAIADRPVPASGEMLHVTASIGIAAFGPDGETIESVIKAADERLYRAKDAGRNRVVN